MKIWIKKIVIAVSMLLCIVGLSGCTDGSTIDTNLVLEQDLSGVREMDVTIDATVFSENFTGDIEQLNQLIGERCPKELTWTYSNADGVDSYHVELAFTSPEDYKKKVESILGEEVTVEISAPETVWANGFRVNEDFTSESLLAWMEDAVVEAGFVEESNKSYVLGLGTTQLTFSDTTYTASSYISLNELEYLSLEKVDILTEINENNLYGRSVIFYIPAKSMDAKKAEIEEFLNGNVPRGADSSWEDTETGKKMTVTSTGMTADGLNSFTATVLASDKNQVTVQETDASSSAFAFASLWNETLDLSGFAGNADGRVKYGYYIKTENGMEVENSPTAQVAIYLEDNEDYDSYQSANQGSISETELEFQVVRNYQVQTAQVTTKLTGQKNFRRTSEFILSAVPTEAQQQTVLARVQEMVGEFGEVKTELADDTYHVTIVQEGMPEDLEEGTKAIFGSYPEFQYAAEKDLMSLTHENMFYEEFDYSKFIGSHPEDFEMTYTVDLGFTQRVSQDEFEDEIYEEDVPEIKGGKVIYTTDSTWMETSFVGSKINIIGILIWAVLFIAAVVMIIGLFRTGVFKMLAADIKAGNVARQEKRMAAQAAANAQAAMNAQAVQTSNQTVAPVEMPVAPAETPVAPVETPVAPVEPVAPVAPAEAAATQEAPTLFCPNCGTACVSGDAFCNNCGHKLSEE